MSDSKQQDLTSTMSARVKLFLELINDKNNQLNLMIENLKRLDGYVLGSKESVDKIEKHIKQQKNEVKDLTKQNKIPHEVATLLDAALNGVLIFAKNISLDAERLFFSKQGEMIFLKQDIEKLINLKNTHESSLNKNVEEQKKIQDDASQKAPAIEEKAKIRPDKNPNTRAGRAAMDIAERRKKSLETMKELKQLKENSGKKRGRKPKAD